MSLVKYLLAAFLLGTTGQLLASEKKEIIMGFNPAENVEVVEINGKRFSEIFKKGIGLPVKTFVASDYTALIEAMRSGRVDFAWLPPFSLVKAEEIAGAEVLLKAKRKGKTHFYSCIITRTDKGFKRVDDLKGKNIAWADPASASGHIIPKASLISQKKIDPEKFFGKQVFAGAHDSLVLAVLNGTVDAGATYCNNANGTDGAWNQFLKPSDANKINVVHVSEAIPGETMATTKKFRESHPKLVEQAVKIITEMSKSKDGKEILQTLYGIDEMVKASSAEYEPVRTAARVVRVIK